MQPTDLMTTQCTALVQGTSGEPPHQCKNTTRLMPYCTVHARSIWGVHLGPSRIEGAGQGLFATRDFVPATRRASKFTTNSRSKPVFIADYGGEIKDIDRSRHNEYGLAIGKNQMLDATHVRGWGAMANDGGATLNNARLVISRPKGRSVRCRLVATKTIRAGNEILVPYGNSYWGR